MPLPKISVIIPMYNAENTIADCLDALFKLNYPKEHLEIIVVNHTSTDESLSIAQRYPVRILHKRGGTISSVRNYGARFAKGEIYGFIDSDCVVQKDWLINALKELRNPDVAATGSGYTCPTNCTWVEKAWLYESKHAVFQTNFITSGNFIVKATAFKAIDGFNENLTTCEDAEICLRLIRSGKKIFNSSKIDVIHLGNPKTINDFIRKEIWYGGSMMTTLKLNYMDRVFAMTLLFFLANIGMTIGIIQAIFLSNTRLFLWSLIMIVGILVVSTLYRIKRSKKIFLFFQTFVLYYFYFMARTIAIFNIRKKNLPKKG